MKTLTFLIIAACVCLPYFVLQTEALSFPKYSITGVHQSDVRVVKKAITGMTVEHLTSYIDENEYTLKIDVIRNKDTEVPDSELVLECFFSENSAKTIVVNLNNVEWTSDYSFNYFFHLVVEQTGWVYFCISARSEIGQQSKQERYHRVLANQVIHLDALRH